MLTFYFWFWGKIRKILNVSSVQVEPTLPEYVRGEGEYPTGPVTEYYQNDYSYDQKASETKVEQATFRIIPLNSGDDITFGEEFPVKEDFPKHIVEKSISDNEPIFFSDPRSEILPAQDNHPSNLNFRSLPDVYDHNEVFPNDAQENADIYDGLDNTDDDHIGEFYFHENTYVNVDLLENKNQLANEYEPESIGHGENY